MKIILQQDVPNLGGKGEIKDVAPGYARNHLLPRKMAVEATPQKLREWEKQKQKEEAVNRQLEEEASRQAEKVSGQVIIFKMPAGNEGRLFGSVTSADVAGKLSDIGVEVDKKKIEFPEPIKSVGPHIANIRLHQGITAELKIVVEKDE
ncbi:MAG: 50S ribosomal protein L9 [Bacillota bacterium]